MMKIKFTLQIGVGIFHTLHFISQGKDSVFLASNLPEKSLYRFLLTESVDKTEVLSVQAVSLPEDSPIHLGRLLRSDSSHCGYILYSRWIIQNYFSALTVISPNWLEHSNQIPTGEMPVIYRDQNLSVLYSPARMAMVVSGEITPDLQDFLKL
jgi:hypothetical protein